MSLRAVPADPVGAAVAEEAAPVRPAAGGGTPGPRGTGGGQDAFVLPDVSGTGGAGATDAGEDERQCGLQSFDLQKVPPDLMLVLDRSSSMNAMVPGAAMGATLWTETLAAVDDVVKNTQSGVNWGLKLFPLPTGLYGLGHRRCPGRGHQLHAGTGQGAHARNQSDRHGPVGGDTHRHGGRGRHHVPQGLLAQRKNPKYIVLATDGEPTCRAGSMTSDSKGAAIAAIQAAAAAGFKTYVIGLAIGAAGTATLNDMAVAGQVPRNDPAVKYYPVANKADLVQSLTAITGQVTNCIFPLSRTPPVPDNVKVTIDGHEGRTEHDQRLELHQRPMTAIQFNGDGLRADQDPYGSGQHRLRLPGNRNSLIPGRRRRDAYRRTTRRPSVLGASRTAPSAYSPLSADDSRRSVPPRRRPGPGRRTARRGQPPARGGAGAWASVSSTRRS